MKGKRVTVEVYEDASFDNEEEEKTQIGYYIQLKGENGGVCPVLWKSKVAKRVVGFVLAAETFSAAEAMDWAEYVKHIWEEMNGKNTTSITLFTDSRSLEQALISVNGVKNRIFRIEMGDLKNRIDEGVLNTVRWLKS